MTPKIKWTIGEYEDGTNFVLIHDLYIPIKQRRQGQARKLLYETLQEIKEVYPILSIEIDAESNDSTINISQLATFYQEFGFKPFLKLEKRISLRLNP